MPGRSDCIAAARASEIADSIVVQEQLALALNRLGDGECAERVLLEVLRKRGPSPETYGILGRVYKDRWEARVQAGRSLDVTPIWFSFAMTDRLSGGLEVVGSNPAAPTVLCERNALSLAFQQQFPAT